MITAKEVKELYDKNVQLSADYLENTVEPAVIKAAQSGRREAIINLGSEEGWIRHLNREITPLQQAIVDQLTELGYSVEIKVYGHSNRLRELLGADVDGPSHINYGIHIGW